MAVRLDPYQNIVGVGWSNIDKWDLTLSGFLFNDRGWSFEDDNDALSYRLRMDFQDSENCGGSNNLVQGGTAFRRFMFDSRVELNISVTGLAELQNEGFEKLIIRIDGVIVLEAESAGGNQLCAMGEPIITPRASFPIVIDANQSVFIEVLTTTGDPIYHTGAFYEMIFTFAPIATQ